MNSPLFFLRRIHLLNKRFFKTPVFLALLILLPLSAFFLNRASQSADIGIKVGYTLPAGATEYTVQAARDAFLDGSLVKCVEFPSESKVEEAVASGAISVGFVFPKDLSESFREFEKRKTVKHKIRVIVKKNTVVSRLVTELIFGKLFPRISCQITRNYIDRTDSLAFAHEGDDEAFAQIYEDNRPTAPIFFVAYSDGEDGMDGLNTKPLEVPVLASPMRGLCSIFLLLLGFAASFYYIRDEKNGLFVWFPKRASVLLRLLYIFLPVLDACAVVLASLYFSGTFTSWQKEVPLLLAHAAGTAAFCAFFCALLSDEALLAGAVPLVLLATFVLCPVFISINSPAALKKIFPPYLYLTGIHKEGGFLDVALYAACALAAAVFAAALRKKR